MSRARTAAIACLVVGIALCGVSLFGHGWGTVNDGGRVGLRDTICTVVRDLCEAGVHGATTVTRTEHEQFARFGEIAFVLGVLAGLAGVAAALHPRVARALAMPATLLAAGAAGVATAFVALEPYFAHAAARWHTGSAWWIFAAGAGSIAAGAQLGAQLGGPRDAPPARWPALALAAAAIALGLTAPGTAWWRGADGDQTTTVGAATVEMCDPGGCMGLRLSDLPATKLERLAVRHGGHMGVVSDGIAPDPNLPRPMIVAGIVVDIAAAVAAVLAAALAAATLARRRARALAWTTLGAAAALAAAITVFESYGPGAAIAPFADVDRSYGLPLAIAGVVLAAAPAVLLARHRPVPVPVPVPVPLPLPLPDAANAIPICATCRVPMIWVGKRAIWLCTRCKARGSVTA